MHPSANVYKDLRRYVEDPVANLRSIGISFRGLSAATVEFASFKPYRDVARTLVTVVYRVPSEPVATWIACRIPAEGQPLWWRAADEAPLDSLVRSLGRSIESSHTEILSYRPHVRITMKVADGDDAIFVKHFTDPALAVSVGRFATQLAGLAPHGLRVPEIKTSVGGNAVFAWIDGTPLPRGVPHLQAVGSGLASLHRLHIAAPHYSLRTILEENSNKLRKLAHIFPSGEAIWSAFAKRLRTLPPRDDPPVFSHGDFHLRQLAHRNGELVCFDFDECCWSSRHRDLASLIVDLHLSDCHADELTHALLAGYQEVASFDVEWLRWYLAVQSLNKVYRGLSQMQFCDAEAASGFAEGLWKRVTAKTGPLQ